MTQSYSEKDETVSVSGKNMEADQKNHEGNWDNVVIDILLLITLEQNLWSSGNVRHLLTLKPEVL